MQTAAGEHGGDEGRGVIGDGAGFGEDGGDEEVFGAGVGGALVDVEGLVAMLGGGHGEGGLADAGGADEAWGEGEVAGVDDEPAGQELAEDVILTDPALLGGVGAAEVEGDTVDGLATRPGWRWVWA